MSSTSDGEKAKGEDGNNEDSDVDIKAKQSAEVSDSSLPAEGRNQVFKEDSTPSQKYSLHIKESSKDWERMLSCSCPNVTNPYLDWVTCVHPDDHSTDIPLPYFLVYSITKKSSLTTVMKKVKKKSKDVSGLILVNHSNSTTLPNDFWDSDYLNNFPLHVVSHTDGQVLLDHLRRLNIGEICVTLRVESSVDDCVLTAMDCRESVYSAEVLHSSRCEVSFLTPLANYLEEAMRVKPAVAISEVLSQFQKCEDELQLDATMTQSLFDQLQQTMTHDNFVQGFLVLVSIAYRMLSKDHVYPKEQSNEYIKQFLGRSEQWLCDALPLQLAMVARQFQASDFEVADLDSGMMSFFTMLCNASQSLLNFTKRIYPLGHYGLKMLWIYLELAFRSPRIPFEWYTDFIQKESFKAEMVTQEELNWLNGAIQFGIQVELSPEMRFSGKDLVDMLVHNMYRFTNLREFLELFQGTLFKNEQDLLMFIRYSHPVCLKLNESKKRNIVKLGSKQDLTTALEEGVSLISDAVLCFGESATQVEEARLLAACTSWWQSLMEPAILHPKEMCGAVIVLSDNLKGCEELLRSRIRSGLTKEFLTKFERKMKGLSLNDFVAYYCSLSIIPNEMVKKYLDSFICPDKLVSSEPFIQLLKCFFRKPSCEFVYHKMFLDLIQTSSKCYTRASDFIHDVLYLTHEHLLADPILGEGETANMKQLRSDFQQYIAIFVRKNKLSREVCTFIRDFVMVRNTFTPMQQAVLEELFKFVIFKESHFIKSDPVAVEFEVIKVVVSNLCTHYKTPDSWGAPPTIPLSLYWGKLVQACQMVKPTTVNVMHMWCKGNQRAVRILATVYSQFSKTCGFKLLPCVPDVVKQSKDDQMKQYFQWVQVIQQLICSWQQKVHAKDWTEAEIEQYAKVISSVNQISTDLCIEELTEDIEGLQNEIQELKNVVKNTLLPFHAGKRCSVLGILHKYNIAIPVLVSNLLTVCPGSFDRRFLGCIHYEGREEDEEFHSFQMKDLMILHKELQQFLTMIGNAHLIDFMVHFSMRNSQIFAQYLKGKMGLQQSLPPEEHEPSVFEGLEHFTPELYEGATAECSDKSRLAIQIFHEALQDTEAFLKNILLGKATYRRLCSLDCLQGGVGAVDVEHELSILETFQFLGTDQCMCMGGMKSILQLIQFAENIDNIRGVCEQYQITGCLNDKGMKRLLEIHGILVSEEERMELNAIRSKQYLEEIRRILDLPERNWHALSIFAVAKDSIDFYQFLKEKHFRGTAGTNFFMQQYTLITSHLQHDEYNEQVLNHLQVAFHYISPFLDTEQSLQKLVNEVYRSCGQAAEGGSTDFVQLHTVNKNINLVRLWFSRAEGDTLENIAEELESLLNTGYFEFVIPESMDVPPSGVSTAPMLWNAGGQRRLLLHYQPSATAQGQKVASDAAPTKPMTWKREQIEDFTRKLGFLEKGAEDGNHFKFQQFSTIAQRAFEVQCELADLGYPQVSKKTMECLDLETAITLVNDLEKKLSDWRQKLKQLHSDYDKLLFFHIPKMLRMSKILHHGSSMLEGILQLVQEVSFLFDSTVETRQHIETSLKEAVLVNFQDVQLPDAVSEMQLPIASLGKVLDNLFHDKHVCHRHFPKRTAPSVMKGGHSLAAQLSSTYTTPRKPLCIMHVATDLKLKDIIQLIYEIYQGIPAPYEVYRCRADSTEEEVSLFFQRTLKFPYLQFCLLDVNMLPLKLQEVLLQLHLALEKQEQCCTIHYIRTGPCILEDMPWVTIQEHKPASLKYDWKQICAMCKPVLNPNQATYSAFELVYGKAGNGKTHYIRKKMKSSNGMQLTVVINESFSARSVIQQLRSLPMKLHNVLYFNFTLLPPSKDSSEVDQQLYQNTMSEVQYFLLDLFFLGYVEDPNSGLSFTMPSELSWACYCEVPSREEEDPDVSCNKFVEELPILELVGKYTHIEDDYLFEVDSDVQLVCKYLNAYDKKDDPIHGINRLYRSSSDPVKPRTRHHKQQGLVRFAHLPDLPVANCHRLLARYMLDDVTMNKNKMYQKLFIGYMKRRCKFLESCPGLNWNPGSVTFSRRTSAQSVKVDTSQFGSTIMGTMLREVSSYCNPLRRSNWSATESTRQQLVYDVQDGGGCFHLIAVNVCSEELEKYRIMGSEPPPVHELATREHLDRYLASAFNLRLENGKLKVIDEFKYVLTLDYTLKMLEIHERFECGIPVIIEGETGVGKTALVEMLSVLWNQSLLGDWRLLRERFLQLLKENCSSINAPDEVMASYMQLVSSIHDQEDTPVLLEDLERVCSLTQVITTTEDPKMGKRKFHTVLRSYVQQILLSPVLTLLDFGTVWEKASVTDKDSHERFPDRDFPAMMEHFQNTQNSQATAGLLFYVLRAQPRKIFHKLNVHAALTPKDFYDFFQTIFKQAVDLRNQWEARGSRVPRVTVFLDEINTSSCMGLLKEVLVDRTFFGQPVPDNIFIVAACNPHRGNSMIVMEKNRPYESWVRSSYNVHRLHPTIQNLMWNYGALNTQQEEQYIKAKMKMTSHDLGNIDRGNLSALIIQSQTLMRRYAANELSEACGYKPNEAAHSCVSQRDIQRVFTLYRWLLDSYKAFGKIRFSVEELADCRKMQERAVLVALAIVYYLRLNQKYRSMYQEELKKDLLGNKTVEEALKEELDFYSENLDVPSGIAKTQALMENMFCIIACCCTKTPLIIVGAPGSSKTLSFNLALANIKGAESKKSLFRDCKLFPSMDPHFYQCSRHTTSVEVETVFQRAVKRQAGFDELKIPINCVVFMDEAGLPEEGHESLKVLHKYLDSGKVSFVAITNHHLDAAKTNRAASLFRTSVSDTDMKTLARDCMGCVSPEDVDATVVDALCEPYQFLINNYKWFKDFFGLRDFIHMIHYLRRRKASRITPELVLNALERNFNGCEDFLTVCKNFLGPLQSSPNTLMRRNVIEILQESLQDKPNHSFDGDQQMYNDVRYKLIIDPSEDDSVPRLLLMCKILDSKETRIFMCSDFPEDSQLQKINTIAAIRHAAVEGQTVLMSQTDDIHDSFYDLFNQHFRRIDNPDPKEEPRFYANIAIGSHHKPCRVHKDFQCVVVVRKSELHNIPAPFLNRFEKYCISHKDFLDARLQSMQPCLRVAVECALEKVHEFFNCVGESSFYGAQKDESVESLALSILPSPDFKFTELTQEAGTTMLQLVEAVSEGQEAESGPLVLLTALINTLQQDAGFHFVKLSDTEMKEDAIHILRQLSSLPSDFQSIAQDILENSHSSKHLIAFVHDAVNRLHLAPAPESYKIGYKYSSSNDILQESCLVVTVMVQWMVLYMSKRLLQLMTAEALMLSRKMMPAADWCLDAYLTQQSHFSLKELINTNLQAFHHSRSSIGTVPTKLMCFTRSTPSIHHLPAVYATLPSSAEHEALMKDMIIDELTPLYLCKLSNVLSEQAFQEHMQSFMKNKEKTVMLLVINIQETSKQTVNYVRIMVEQAVDSATGTQKLFVLLLHFPLSMLYNPCYPALFLNGWDHHYLDSVQPEPEGIVDIKQWFSVACQQRHHHGHIRQTAIVKAAKSMIPSSVSIISSRVSIGSKKGGHFNSMPTDGSDRVRRFEQLLYGPVGTGLCRMYARYWQPADMAHYLEEAALYSKDHKSSLSITDSVKGFFKTAFHNFLAYMINLINEDLNLDIVFAQDCNAVLDLFIQLMDLLPKLPKLVEVKAYNNTWPPQQAYATIPSFPFFRRVATAMDKLIDMSVEKMQSTKEPVVERSTVADSGSKLVSGMASSEDSYKNTLYVTLEKQLVDSLDSDENPLLKVAVTAIGEHKTLWQRYWKDFVANRFHLDVREDKLTFDLLNLTFAHRFASLDTKKKLVMLHATAYTNQINLARLVSSLRSIQKLQKVVEMTPVPTTSAQSASAKFMSVVEKNPKHVQNQETLYQFITGALFEALAGVCLNCGHEEINYCDPKNLKTWRDSYRDVTSQTSVKKLLFHFPLREEPYVGKLNSMAAVFLLLQVRPELDEEICNLAFWLGKNLLEQYFSEELQMMRTCPRLPEIVKIFLDVVKSNPNKLNKAEITAYLENILTFFFSSVELEDNDVIWFLRYVNSLCSVGIIQNEMELSQDETMMAMEEDSSVTAKEQSPLLNVLSTAMAKRVLGEILTHPQGDEKVVSPLHIFHGKARRLVAQVLLEQGNQEGQVGLYFPLVYRRCPDIATAPNPRMEQPLADLYFLVAMEHLVGEENADMRLETALRKLSDVNESISQATPKEKEVLQIEQQAAVQMVLWKTAQCVADNNCRVTALQLSSDIKRVVQVSATGGRKDIGDELVFMMHLLKQLNGPTALLKFLHDTNLGDLPFLTSYKDKLIRIGEESSHLFPFMLHDAKGHLAQVYCKVKQLMTTMITVTQMARTAQMDKFMVDGLAEIAKSNTLEGQSGKNVHTKRFLRMVVWLVVYYEFYSKRVTCPHLMDIIGTQLQFLEFTDNQLQILKCFLLPNEMVHSPEAPLPQDANAEILELGHDGQPQRRLSKVLTNQVDPIYELFHPPETCRDDPSDVQLRHALANLIAVTFSLPPGSTHLWYFLFDQLELEDTYLPGFRYPVKVAPNKMFYDCGVLLNSDGQFDRPDYHDHSSPLSLHSFYLLEWATFGALCIALLTNPEAERKIHGHIISDWQPLRHFCMEQLRQIWLFMRSSLDLSDEERSFLIMQAMHRLFESECLPGKFESPEDVRCYEQHWHYLYEARKHGLGEKLKEQSQLANYGFFKTLSVIDAMYPKFPTERQFRNNLESLLGGSDPSRPKYPILAHFMDDRERLSVGSALLPDLVEMYLWLDTHLAHLLPYEDDLKLTLGDIITKACKRYPSEAGHIRQLYERLTDSYNRYVKVNGGGIGTGGCVRHRHDRQATKLNDSTPVIRLLSTDDSREGGKNDWLCLVMQDIISAHNNLVQMVASQDKHASFHCWLQSTPLTVDVREFSTAEALFFDSPQLRSKEQILNMIRSHYHSDVPEDPSGTISVTVMSKMTTRAMFDFSKLESDVVRCFIAGKPFINKVESTLRRPFRFRDNKVDSSTATSGMAGPGCPVDLAALSQELHESCKDELTKDRKKGLEAVFHSASYNVLSDLVTGVRTVAGYLCQTLQQKGPPVLDQTLMQFLSRYFGKEHPSSDVLKWEGFTAEQLHALETLPVKYLYKTLEMFVGWITDCLYDFHELPFAVKRPLPDSVQKWVELKIAEIQMFDPLETVKDLENTVSHIEQGLHRPKEDINPLQPLREYLITFGFYSEDDQMPLQLVHDDVLLQHYMYFVVLLRKWKLKLQSSCSPYAATASPCRKVWLEVVPDVWKKLFHFQDNTVAKPPLSVEDQDNDSSVSQGSERLWLDSEEPVSESATQVESREDPISEGDVNVNSSAARRIDADTQDDGLDQSAMDPRLSEKSLQPSEVRLSPDHDKASLQQSTKESLLSRQPSESAKKMTTQQVVEWLNSIKLSEYAKIFEDNDVDGETLACITLETLEELGIMKDFHRRKILLQFRKIK